MSDEVVGCGEEESVRGVRERQAPGADGPAALLEEGEGGGVDAGGGVVGRPGNRNDRGPTSSHRRHSAGALFLTFVGPVIFENQSDTLPPKKQPET